MLSVLYLKGGGMRDAFLGSVKQLGIFMICAQAILHFRPDSSYEKYMKLVIGIMVLVQLVIPFAKIFSAEWDIELGEKIKWYQQQMQVELNNQKITNSQVENILKNIAITGAEMKLNESQNEENQNTENQNIENKNDSIRNGNVFDIETGVDAIQSIEKISIN